jgi:membrane protein YqaA with SNARE-associated domain
MNALFSSSPESLWGLFISAFLSSTLLPGGSEIVLAYLSIHSSHEPWLLLVIATTGNTLGGMSSWLIGWLVSTGKIANKLKNKQNSTAINAIKKWGSPLLLLSWAPIIGDAFCVAAGWLRINVLLALVFICVGKAIRYALILSLT